MNRMPVTRPAARWRDIDGILLLDKPEGLTSNAALQRLRRLFNARKAGHTGSLDPLASGLLPICFGQATKVSGLLLDANKTYAVTVVLGERTATGDREGEVVERQPVPELDDAAIRRVTARFLGVSEQVPPMYSALKRQGQRLYRLARLGLEVERAARRIVVHRMELLGTEGRQLQFEVECSKGTYIRTLAEDFARACGTTGHVGSLRRLSLGPFVRPTMHTLAGLEEAAVTPMALDSLLLPIDAALQEMPAVRLSKAEQTCVLQGQPVFVTGPGSARVRMYGEGGLFLGTGRMTAEGRRLAPERIMVDITPRAPKQA
ncbi:MAG: tRNA pseudouridine(55) synthase TruB [Steroidobacteraceae bacterium]